MRAFTLHYTLRNGQTGSLVVLAGSSSEAILKVMDTFGRQLRACSAKPGLAS